MKAVELWVEMTSVNKKPPASQTHTKAILCWVFAALWLFRTGHCMLTLQRSVWPYVVFVWMKISVWVAVRGVSRSFCAPFERKDIDGGDVGD